MHIHIITFFFFFFLFQEIQKEIVDLQHQLESAEEQLRYTVKLSKLMFRYIFMLYFKFISSVYINNVIYCSNTKM